MSENFAKKQNLRLRRLFAGISLVITLIVTLGSLLLFTSLNNTQITMNLELSKVNFSFGGSQPLFSQRQVFKALSLKNPSIVAGPTNIHQFSEENSELDYSGYTTDTLWITVKEADNSKISIPQLRVLEDWAIVIQKSSLFQKSYSFELIGYPSDSPLPFSGSGIVDYYFDPSEVLDILTLINEEVELGFKGESLQFSILKPKNEQVSFELPISVTEIDFTTEVDRGNQQIFTSNILDGTLRFNELNREPIELVRGQILELGLKNAVITELTLGENAINLVLQGNANTIKTGIPTDITRSLMPSRLELWQSEKRVLYFITAIGSLIIVLSALAELFQYLKVET